MKLLLIVMLFLTCQPFTSAQVNLRISSANKTIWNEQGMLERLAFDKYREKVLMLQTNIQEVVKNEIKSLVSNATRNETVKLGVYPFNGTLSEYEGKIRFDFKLPYNSVEFRVTTPDVIFGIGRDRENDPSVTIVYDLLVSVPIEQNGTSSSISFLRPEWKFKIRSYHFNKYDEGSVEKLKIQTWITGNNMAAAFRKVYYAMDDLTDRFNDHINQKIKNNPALLKEMAVDETSDLEVKISNGSNLVFEHKHSQAGIVKRMSTEDASILKEEMKLTQSNNSTVPVSTSPGKAKNGPASTNVPSSIPTSTSPAGATKGPGVIQKPPPKIEPKPVIKN